MLVFIKLGGSLITNKSNASEFRASAMMRLAEEIKRALDERPELRILLGHGSGSFGHYEASKYNTISGVHTAEQWRGFARVAFVASQLNFLVAQTLDQAGLPIFRVQPSASVIASRGSIHTWTITAIERALEYGLIPLVYGDVAFDDEIGGTILSTEILLAYLVPLLPVESMYLLGDVDGVYDDQGKIISHINSSNYEQVSQYLSGSAGVDVTGGMLTKVRDMSLLATRQSALQIRIFSGLHPNLLYETLVGKTQPGTLITV